MLRIVAGELRGRRIPVPTVPGLRPTGERVREALFNILGDRVVGARVLDAYAGTGALGFEALSRGASHVVFVEADRVAASGLERSATSLGVAGRCRVVRGRVLDVLGHAPVGGPFELILADPPWKAMEGPELVARAGSGASAGLVAVGGLVVVERASRDPGIPSVGCLEHRRTARYGDTALDFFAQESPDPPRS